MAITWEEADVQMPVIAEDDPRPRYQIRREERPEITQFERAEEQQKPIVLYIYTASTERRAERAVATCQTFFTEIMQAALVTHQLQHCVCLKLEGSDLDRDVAREFDIRRNCVPQVLIYDFRGEPLFRMAGPSEEELIANLEASIEYCQQLAEYLAEQEDDAEDDR